MSFEIHANIRRLSLGTSHMQTLCARSILIRLRLYTGAAGSNVTSRSEGAIISHSRHSGM